MKKNNILSTVKNVTIKTIDFATDVAIGTVSAYTGTTVGTYVISNDPMNFDNEIGVAVAGVTSSAVTSLVVYKTLLDVKNKARMALIKNKMQRKVEEII